MLLLQTSREGHASLVAGWLLTALDLQEEAGFSWHGVVGYSRVAGLKGGPTRWRGGMVPGSFCRVQLPSSAAGLPMDGVAASHWPLPESKEVASHSSGLAGRGRFLSAWSDGLFEGCEAKGGGFMQQGGVFPGGS